MSNEYDEYRLVKDLMKIADKYPISEGYIFSIIFSRAVRLYEEEYGVVDLELRTRVEMLRIRSIDKLVEEFCS
jgi:hypothetical protein